MHVMHNKFNVSSHVLCSMDTQGKVHFEVMADLGFGIFWWCKNVLSDDTLKPPGWKIKVMIMIMNVFGPDHDHYDNKTQCDKKH